MKFKAFTFPPSTNHLLPKPLNELFLLNPRFHFSFVTKFPRSFIAKFSNTQNLWQLEREISRKKLETQIEKVFHYAKFTQPKFWSTDSLFIYEYSWKTIQIKFSIFFFYFSLIFLNNKQNANEIFCCGWGEVFFNVQFVCVCGNFKTNLHHTTTLENTNFYDWK